MTLVCNKYITFYVDKSHTDTCNSKWETHNMAKSLFYLYKHVQDVLVNRISL